jgi:hypothetical protein
MIPEANTGIYGSGRMPGSKVGLRAAFPGIAGSVYFV